MKSESKVLSAFTVSVLGLWLSLPVFAAPTSIAGQINDVTVAGDEVLIRVNAGLPDNCAGTMFGWMRIPPESKAMIAFVIGLWMRGDASQTSVVVYTDGMVGSYCRVNQIDPVG
jgi:hypothetical protein